MARHWRSYGRSGSYHGGGFWRPYVPVAARQAKAAKLVASMQKKGRGVEPIEIEGRTIARTFWGKSWCENLERYSDYSNRLPRGRTYVRNGSVIDLQISSGCIDALVSGSEIYKIHIDLAKVDGKRWDGIRKACAGKIDSVVELLGGRISGAVMEILTARETGLFPMPKEIKLECSCPDWATMCKHVAAVLYGVGARLDSRPDLLFILRGVDQTDLVTEAAAGAVLLGTASSTGSMDSGEMENIFGIEIDKEAGPGPRTRKGRPAAAKSPAAPGRLKAKALKNGRRSRPNPKGAKEEAPLVKRGRPSRHAKGKARAEDPRGPSTGGIGSRIPVIQEHFGREESLTNTDYRRLFSIPIAVASRELGQLAAQGILIRRGLKRGTHYVPGVGLGGA